MGFCWVCGCRWRMWWVFVDFWWVFVGFALAGGGYGWALLGL